MTSCNELHPEYTSVKCQVLRGHAGPHYSIVAGEWPLAAGSYTRTDEHRNVDPYAEQSAQFWHDRWKEAADQRDARDAAAHQWKEATRNLVRQRGDARTNAMYWANTSAAQTGAIERWQDRAEKAEGHLRDRTVDLVAAIEDRDKARRERDAALRVGQEALNGWREEQEHRATCHDCARGAFTADALTDAGIERARGVWETAHGCEDVGVTLRRAFVAAVTEPLARPAWHDAVAVTAHTRYRSTRQVWVPDVETPGRWVAWHGLSVAAETLVDPVPLVEVANEGGDE